MPAIRTACVSPWRIGCPTRNKQLWRPIWRPARDAARNWSAWPRPASSGAMPACCAARPSRAQPRPSVWRMAHWNRTTTRPTPMPKGGPGSTSSIRPIRTGRRLWADWVLTRFWRCSGRAEWAWCSRPWTRRSTGPWRSRCSPPTWPMGRRRGGGLIARPGRPPPWATSTSWRSMR